MITVLGFCAGALPFSLWVGRLALRQDIRQVGDGNPGATNVLKAGGIKWAAIAFLLDFLKGAIPVAVAQFVLRLDDGSLWLVAMAPPLGHAFSPLLGFKGGKALACIGGVWCGLTIWEIPTVGGLLLGFWFIFINESAWAVVLMALSVLAYLLLTGSDGLWLAVWGGHFLLTLWKHRAELTQLPSLRPWYRSLVLPWH
ncbi:MAG: glycerol-3-phosphate acyltransferase [Anaerolineae bacterium]|nr:glycerol-3-phosphate acyltransferase [Anaerolineae bacterium]